MFDLGGVKGESLGCSITLLMLPRGKKQKIKGLLGLNAIDLDSLPRSSIVCLPLEMTS